jgi:hypothetical protein
MSLSKMDLMYNEGKLNTISETYSCINKDDRSFLATALEKRKKKNEKYNNV